MLPWTRRIKRLWSRFFRQAVADRRWKQASWFSKGITTNDSAEPLDGDGHGDGVGGMRKVRTPPWDVTHVPWRAPDVIDLLGKINVRDR